MRYRNGLALSILVLPILMTGCCAPASAPAPESQVTILYQENCQFILTSPEGIKVFIDVGNPGLLTSSPTEQDILLTTHSHIGHHHLTSHYDQAFGTSFPGQQLNMKAGEISSGDVAVKGIQLRMARVSLTAATISTSSTWGDCGSWILAVSGKTSLPRSYSTSWERWTLPSPN